MRIFVPPFVVWVFLCLPALHALFVDLVNSKIYDPFSFTGRVSSWLLALTLIVTPLKYLFGPSPLIRALVANRRYFGVASFAYGVLHTLYWMKDTRMQFFWDSFVRAEVLPGWIALFVMVPLVWTSRDSAVRRMGPGWKRLQRWVYPCAALTLLHWLLCAFGYRPVEILVVALPVLALEAWRINRYLSIRGSAG